MRFDRFVCDFPECSASEEVTADKFRTLPTGREWMRIVMVLDTGAEVERIVCADHARQVQDLLGVQEVSA